MQATAGDERLKRRILHALSDDEEYPEEIYCWVNFDIEERPPAPGGVLYYRAYKTRYRLTEILEALKLLEQSRLITSRVVEGYDSICGITARLYRLTDGGEHYLKEHVLHNYNSLFD